MMQTLGKRDIDAERAADDSTMAERCVARVLIAITVHVVEQRNDRPILAVPADRQAGGVSG
jgi:hypothetical protein